MKSKILIWTIVAIVIVIWFWQGLRNYVRSVILALRLPGPKPLPIVGNLMLIKDDNQLHTAGNNATKLFGPLFRAWMLHIPIFFIYEPDHLKIVLGGAKIYSEKNFFYSLAKTFLGEGLVTNNESEYIESLHSDTSTKNSNCVLLGYKWRKNRRLIQPYFSVNILETYFDMFVNCAEDIIKSLCIEDFVNITKIVNLAVVRSLHKAVLGISLDDLSTTPFRSGEMLIIKRATQPWLLLEPIFRHSNMSRNESRQKNSLREYTKQAMKDRIEVRKTTKSCPPCLLDMFIEIFECNTEFREDDVINETITFMLAGQDSVGTALAMCFYFLAKNVEIQEKVNKEINEIIYEDDLKTIKIEQLNQMHYLEQCIKESLRLCPSIPLIFRVLRSDVNLGPYTIPAGSNVCISPFITHRLPHVFPDPLEYHPDRFSPENIQNMHPFSFVPFSAGPRNCIGFKFAILQMKTVLASIIKNYKLSLQPGKEELNLTYRVTLRVKGGIWVKATPRKSNSSGRR